MSWLERALYLVILVVLGVSVAFMHQRNSALADKAAAVSAQPAADPAATAGAAGESDDDDDDEDDDEEEG